MTSPVQSPYLTIIERVAAMLLLVYPTFMLVIRGGMNGVFALLLLLALAALLVKPKDLGAVKWNRDFTVYGVSMLAMSVAIFFSQTALQHYTAHPHDAASRYWLAIPVFLLLHRLRIDVFKTLQFAFPVAAITGLLLVKDLGEKYGHRLGIDALDLIHFGDFELILGVMSLLSIDWFSRDGMPMRALKVTGFIAGIAASAASGSRGGWLAVPVFIAIFLYFRPLRVSWRLALAAMVVASLAFTAAYLGSATFHQRVHGIANDVAAFGQGDRDTSTGIRWQLYGAAADVISRHPLFGVGPEGFAQEMGPMAAAGKISPEAAELGRGEVHNDILAKTAGMGLFGLIAILVSYLVPLRMFWKAAKSPSAQARRAAVLGVTFISGYFVFGLTEETLSLTMATAFYSFTVAVLLAACYNNHARGDVSPSV